MPIREHCCDRHVNKGTIDLLQKSEILSKRYWKITSSKFLKEK